MRLITLLLLTAHSAASFTSPYVCSAAPPGAPWCNTSLPLPARIAALVAAFPARDKSGALTAAPWPTGGSSTLNLPPASWWQEMTHGAATRAPVEATFFPMPSLTACAFNASLFRAIGSAAGREGRAIANLFAPTASFGFWAPNINTVRDCRWGRAQEVPGEDVYLSSRWAEAYVTGMQIGEGEDPRFLQVVATAKHLSGYDFDGRPGGLVTRANFDAVVSLRDLADSFLPMFQAAVGPGGSGVRGVMAAYTALNGTPSAASHLLLSQLLPAWGFSGYATGDCGAVEQVGDCAPPARCHNFTHSNSSTVAAVLNAGLTMDCGAGFSQWLDGAVASGAVAPGLVDGALARNLLPRFLAGAFDDPRSQPMAAWGNESICTQRAAALSLEAAEEGMVLLKNAGAPSGLPLRAPSLRSLALLGGNANDTLMQMCSYYAPPCGGFSAIVTPLAALTAALQPRGAALRYAKGCDAGCGGAPDFGAAVAAAAASDATVLVVGLNCQLAGEGNDRGDDIALPGATSALISAACAAAAPRPCVVALATGSSLDVSAEMRNPNVTAVLLWGYSGPRGGEALARAVLGLAAPPAGRLAATWYTAGFAAEVNPMELGMRPGVSNLPPFTNPGHTHRFYTGNATLFPFGYGLSYTTWVYTPVGEPQAISLHEVSAAAKAHVAAGGLIGHIPATLLAITQGFWVNVTNTGAVDSDNVVLGFLVPPNAGKDGAPLQELFGFERVFVAAGQTVTVYLGAQGAAFTQVGADGMRRAVRGVYRVRFGLRGAASASGFAEFSVAGI